ncbi:MAG: hypothetical protein HWN81_00015 [Candidatus Lokiarchaeota archaeon]|nr:hypothetical protein [Candidatus Lokiarchaeota archaeon]
MEKIIDKRIKELTTEFDFLKKRMEELKEESNKISIRNIEIISAVKELNMLIKANKEKLSKANKDKPSKASKK